MAGDQQEINELNREWRREVSDSLKDLRTQLSSITNQISELRNKYALDHDVIELSKRVRLLENDKSKMIGGFVVLQSIGGFIIWLITKLS